MNTLASSATVGGSTLLLEYLSRELLAAESPSWWRNTLGVVGFGALPNLGSVRVPTAGSMTPVLKGPELIEVWRVESPGGLVNGEARHSGLNFRSNEDLFFGSIALDEKSLSGRDAEPLMRATEIAYQEVFEVLAGTQHPHLIRIWNYLADINVQSGGDERYRHFNSARQMAFRKSGRATMGTVPAACALGSPSGSPLTVYFLA